MPDCPTCCGLGTHGYDRLGPNSRYDCPTCNGTGVAPVGGDEGTTRYECPDCDDYKPVPGKLARTDVCMRREAYDKLKARLATADNACEAADDVVSACSNDPDYPGLFHVTVGWIQRLSDYLNSWKTSKNEWEKQ